MTLGNGTMPERDPRSLAAALEWQTAMGADEVILDAPVDRYAEAAARKAARSRPHPPVPSTPVLPMSAPSPQPAAPRPTPDVAAPLGAAEARALGRDAVAGCRSLDALRQALETFDGCALRHTATRLVFGDGNPEADIMVIGEAPGADEDRQGKPFVGVSGRLLDRMLSFIGLTRENFYITNTVYWRPPGNRKPNDGEFAVCRPFVEKHIELVAPKALLLVGDKAVRGLAGVTAGITRSRGKWYDVQIAGRAIPAMASFHPAYLLRVPAAKRQAWQDLLALQRRMREPETG